MVIKQKTSNMSMKTPLRICLLAGASSVVMAAVVVTLSSPAVHADAPLSSPAPLASPALPVRSATPAGLSPQESASERSANKLHGVASWYGTVFHGRLTASGERFNMYAMTACHPTLPFGSIVRVVNRENNRSVVVRITDRGFLYDGRVIDLSYAAARKLLMSKDGLAKVDLHVISFGQPHSTK
jgi:rare lipoprotein A